MKKFNMTKRAKFIFGSAIAVLAIVTAFLWLRKEAKAPKYREVEVQKISMDVHVLATGAVQPQNRVDIKPTIAGRVDKVLVRAGDVVKTGQLLALTSSSERATLLDVARTKGPEEVAKWEDLYKPTPILAPINGTVIQRQVEPGKSFGAGDAAFVMAVGLMVEAQIDETDIASIKVGQKAEVILDAYPDTTIEGKVEQIAYDAEEINKVMMYKARVIPIKTPDFMRSGMTSNVSFSVGTRDNILVVPSEAIQIMGQGNEVMVRDAKTGEVISRRVSVGASDGKNTEITRGLNLGEKVLIREFEVEGDEGLNSEKGGSFMSRRRRR